MSRSYELLSRMFGSKSFHRVQEKRVRKFRPPAWAVLLVAIFALWESVSLSGLVSSTQLPALHDVFLALIQLAGTPFFLAHVGQSFANVRSEEHTSELQSLTNLVCRLLLEK